MTKKDLEELKIAIGPLESAIYGNTIETMMDYERKEARNGEKVRIMDTFNLHWKCTGVDVGGFATGEWV